VSFSITKIVCIPVKLLEALTPYWRCSR
jgi:hypothetical protein